MWEQIRAGSSAEGARTEAPKEVRSAMVRLNFSLLLLGLIVPSILRNMKGPAYFLHVSLTRR